MMSKNNTDSTCVAGMTDYFPIDMKYRNWLFSLWKQCSENYGFDEYDSSILENTKMYTCKGGDDILSEMYNLNIDNTNLTIRPEMTPTFARMVLSKIKEEVMPIKWFSIPSCYRYGDISSGRKRCFYQWNVDIVGGENNKSELEIFSILVRFLKKIGLSSNNFEICISNRMILEKVLRQMNINDEAKILKIFNIIDKLAKLTENELKNKLKEEGLNDDNIKQIFELTKITEIKDLELLLGKNDETIKEMMSIFEMAKKMEIDNWLKFDVSIVRGLSYYTGIVFEGYFKNSRIKKAVCGGGRYDNLLQNYGYKDKINSCGFGMGDLVVILGLEDLDLLPKFQLEKDYVIIPFNDDYYVDACKIAEMLRDKNKTVDVYQKRTKIRIAYNYANKKYASYVIYIAPDEWKDEKIIIKDLRTHNLDEKQITINLSTFYEKLV